MTGPDAVTVIEPYAFWVTAMPLAAPVIGPVRFTLRFAGLACVAPVALRSMASPVPVVTLPLPVIAAGPFAVDIALTVPVKLGGDPSTRVPPVPANATVQAEEPVIESVPLPATRTAWLAVVPILPAA